MTKPYFDITDIQDELASQGIKVYNAKKVSQHPDDWYLRVILAQNSKGEYVTWLYNHTTKGCNHGHYYQSYHNAHKDFVNRY